MYHYEILQNLTGEERFLNLEILHKQGKEIQLGDYCSVFDATIEWTGNIMGLLEELFRIYNTDDRPAGYIARSMSVSDIVIVDGEGAYFCDSDRWVKLPGFDETWGHRTLLDKMKELASYGKELAPFCVHQFCSHICTRKCRLAASTAFWGTDDTCPLSSYKIRLAKAAAVVPFDQATISAYCNTICLNCPHSSLTVEQGQVVLSISQEHCTSCPVVPTFQAAQVRPEV